MVNNPLFGKILNCVPKEFVTTPPHSLCTNFTEIILRKVGETMRCFADKNLAKCVFSAPFYARLAEGAKSLQGACHVILRLPVKFHPNRFRLAGVIPEKVTSYEYCIPSTYKN